MVVAEHRFVAQIVCVAAIAALSSAALAGERSEEEGEKFRAVEVEVAAPFELDEAENQRLDDVLGKWERQSSNIRSFRCEFTLLQYDPVFGHDGEPRTSHGRIAYRWPCSASFRLRTADHQVQRWDRDESAVYEFDYKNKSIRVYSIDRGKRPTGSWPIPLLFRVAAADLKRDYWLRIKPDHDVKDRIWIELHPKRQVSGFAGAMQLLADHTSGEHFIRYQRLDVLLDEQSLATCAIRIPSGGGKQTSFVFDQISASPAAPENAIYCWFTSMPNGWKKVIVR